MCSSDLRITENVGREGFGDAIAPAQAIEAGFGEEDGIVFAALRFAEAGVHVATKIADVQIGAHVAQLGLAPQTAGANARALAKVS